MNINKWTFENYFTDHGSARKTKTFSLFDVGFSFDSCEEGVTRFVENVGENYNEQYVW